MRVVDDVADFVLAVAVLNVEGRALIEEWAADPAVNHGLIVPGDDGSGARDEPPPLGPGTGN